MHVHGTAMLPKVKDTADWRLHSQVEISMATLRHSLLTQLRPITHFTGGRARGGA